MKLYFVRECVIGEQTDRIFSSYEKAREFILQEYDHVKTYESWAEEWISYEGAETHFHEVDGIEDFMYIELMELDDNSPIDWSEA